MDIFREDWLSEVLRVPYVPTLGAVSPGVTSSVVFEAVAAVAGTGRFLPYDPDRRWFAVKRERVLIQKVIHEPGTTVIPVLSARGRPTLSIFAYTRDEPDLAELGERRREWRAGSGVEAVRIVWFRQVPDGARTRLMLKAYAEDDVAGEDSHVTCLAGCAAAATWEEFVRDSRESGFAFLSRRMGEGFADGSVLVAIDDERIVGAAGPLSLMGDAVGEPMVPPQYFSVLPGYRGRGHGRALWRASAAWAYANGARYKVLQAESGSAAERLYLSEGLLTLGFVNVSWVV